MSEGATAWSSYNTPRIWAMVANEDNPESWRQVAALGSMAGLLKDQRSRLEAAKQKLIDAWPPEKNKAAVPFIEMIDDLLFTMDKNKKIADSNADALSQVLTALSQAKVEIEPLYQSYLKKSDDWVPGWWDGAEDELDEKAREQMRAAERIVADPGNAIQPPDPYEFKPGTYVGKRIGSDESGPDRADSPAAVGRGGVGGISVPHDPPPPLPETEALSPSAGGNGPNAPTGQTPSAVGPGLAGVITPAPVPPPALGGPLVPPTQAAPVLGPPLTPGLIIGGSRGLGGAVPPGGVGSRGLGSPVGIGPLGRGGGSASKPAVPSWLPPSSGQPPARGTGGQPGRGVRSGNLMPMPQSARSQGKSGDRREGLKFDPDNPWATEQGVDPVIEPSRVQHRHDPGPGVIGWHA